MKVFWAWQSDLDGKISRHFVRAALEKAIGQLNEQADIEARPDEQMELDHDRKDIPGSPDLAVTIFEKIKASKVFVADVTPVAKTENDKRIINPNVAIEIGYALASLGDKQVLFIMNESFGTREDLPFDIKHKAGPLFYRLSEGADNGAIEAEQKRFCGTLKEALKPYRRAPISKPSTFESFKSNRSDGFFVAPGTTLAESPRGVPPQQFSMDQGSHIYLKISPKFSHGDFLDLAAMKLVRAKLGSFSAFPESDESAIWHRENEWGIIAFNLARDGDQLIGSLTQSFRSGEIWGVNTDAIKHGSNHNYINSTSIENAFRNSLPRYIDYICDLVPSPFPIVAEAGAVHVLNKIITASGQIIDNNLKIARDDIVHQGDINNREGVNNFLLGFFEKIYQTAGRKRPQNLNGFPPSRNDSGGE